MYNYIIICRPCVVTLLCNFFECTDEDDDAFYVTGNTNQQTSDSFILILVCNSVCRGLGGASLHPPNPKN